MAEGQGQGRFASLWAAQDMETGQQVVIKVRLCAAVWLACLICCSACQAADACAAQDVPSGQQVVIKVRLRAAVLR
jgi:hypothetical protein